MMIITMKLPSIDDLTLGNDGTTGEGNEIEGNPLTAGHVGSHAQLTYIR